MESCCGQVDFTEMGRVATKSAAVLLSPATDQNSTLDRQADALFETTKAGPGCKPTSPQPCVPCESSNGRPPAISPRGRLTPTVAANKTTSRSSAGRITTSSGCAPASTRSTCHIRRRSSRGRAPWLRCLTSSRCARDNRMRSRVTHLLSCATTLDDHLLCAGTSS